jgi:predicted small lipoprotein YifL
MQKWSPLLVGSVVLALFFWLAGASCGSPGPLYFPNEMDFERLDVKEARF